MNTNEKFTIKNKIKYAFDNKVSKGSLGFIRILIVASVAFAILIAGLIILFNFNEDGTIASTFWNSISTIINAWMPSFEDGSLGYVIMMSIVAIAGLLFTSVLIGIITSAIEEKIDNLKKGNSIVLEKGHIIVLGFYPGEYTLLNQLVLAAEDSQTCILVAEDMDREEMEGYISDNIDIPKNVRIICRTVDITDPISLEKCTLETSKTIIVNPTDDIKTIKAILAVSNLLEEKGTPEISVNAIISNDKYKFPTSIAEANNITTIQTNNILAKMIAHACTQNGLSQTFREIFNFEGSEFYLKNIPEATGKTFSDLLININNATPIGIYRDNKTILNPDSKLVLKENDKIIIFSENSNSVTLENKSLKNKNKLNINQHKETANTVIIGHNETLPIVIQELPENVTNVYLVNQEEKDNELEKIARKRNINLIYYKEPSSNSNSLLEIAQLAKHIVILNSHDEDKEQADMDVIFLLLNLRDIKKRYNLSFNITAEMQLEQNQKLIGKGDTTDFIVLSSMSSLILAQLAESPELIDAFKEILSNTGNELYLKEVEQLQLEGEYTTRELRKLMIDNNYIFLGYLDSQKVSHFNLKLYDKIYLTKEDKLIVIGEE